MAHLRDLSRGDYTHKFFVDGPVVVTNRKLTPGKNLLVGALGKGGRGLYGLDVSSPGTFDGSGVKWELAQTSGNNMGLVTGRPILAKVKSGAVAAVSYTHLRAHETVLDLVCRLLLEKKKTPRHDTVYHHTL